jgi:hypothetical protein
METLVVAAFPYPIETGSESNTPFIQGAIMPIRQKMRQAK